MAKVKVAFGYDTESPRGDFARTPEGKDFRKRHNDLVRRIISTFDAEMAPRTFFMLGQYLEQCLDDYSKEDLRELYNPRNPLTEIQQHSYSHEVFGEVKGREDKKPITVQQFLGDLERASEVLADILGIVPIGLRTPMGYEHDMSRFPDLVRGLEEQGFLYVSSHLRSGSLPEGILSTETQPHTYSNIGFDRIVEIPTQGYQDTIFTKDKSMKYLKREPMTKDEIVAHYLGLFGKAKSMAQDRQVYLGLCLHPWAVMQYDPDLEIHRQLIDGAKKEDIEIVSYGDIARELVLKRQF